MKKNLLLVILALSLVVSLAGCGDKKANSENAKNNAGNQNINGNVVENSTKPEASVENLENISEQIVEPDVSENNVNNSKKISSNDAKNIALEHANVSLSSASNVYVEYDIDDVVPSYEVEFFIDNDKYEYDIDANSGTIIKSEKS